MMIDAGIQNYKAYLQKSKISLEKIVGSLPAEINKDETGKLIRDIYLLKLKKLELENEIMKSYYNVDKLTSEMLLGEDVDAYQILMSTEEELGFSCHFLSDVTDSVWESKEEQENNEGVANRGVVRNLVREIFRPDENELAFREGAVHAFDRKVDAIMKKVHISNSEEDESPMFSEEEITPESLEKTRDELIQEISAMEKTKAAIGDVLLMMLPAGEHLN